MHSTLMMAGFVFLFFFPITAFTKNPLYRYNEQIVSLSGVTSFKIFPGPPNYESIADGDKREGAVLLTLDKEIDAIASPDAMIKDDRENNVKILHVANNNDKNWLLLRPGHHIKITGTLYHRLSGHNHTRVLIDVIKVEPYDIKNRNSPSGSLNQPEPVQPTHNVVMSKAAKATA